MATDIEHRVYLLELHALAVCHKARYAAFAVGIHKFLHQKFHLSVIGREYERVGEPSAAVLMLKPSELHLLTLQQVFNRCIAKSYIPAP